MVEQKQELINNPAARLCNILSKAIKIKGSVATVEVLAKVLNFDPNCNRDRLSAIANFLELISETELAIETLENANTELHLNSIHAIRNIFGTADFDSSWQTTKLKIQPTILTELSFSSDLLSRQYGEIVLSIEDLEELYTKVIALLEEVKLADLEKKLKSLLIEKLQDMEQALFNYELKGSKGLRNSFEATLGAIMLNNHLLQKERAEKNTVLNKFFNLLTRLDLVLRIAHNANQLGVVEIVKRLLPEAK